MSMGDNLNAARRKCGLSEEELSLMLNVPERTVIEWEIGTKCPDANQLARLSDIFDMSLDTLVRGKIVVADKRGRKGEDDEMKEIRKSVGLVRKRIEDVMWSVLVIVYLIMGFGFHLWHPGWLIFIVGAAIESYLKYLETKSIEEMKD